uniref:Transthyretin-like family protein n=1 Tax=Acrobeloides nanus TaxID=290746 RepID=A0A914DPB4_9BILA
MLLKLIFAVLFFLLSNQIWAKTTGTQSIRIKGKFMCGDEPASETLVTLFEENEVDGTFDLSGSKSESGQIKPYLKVFNRCDNIQLICQRHWRFELNNLDLYINSGKVPEKAFDIGTFNLAEKLCGSDDTKLQTVIQTNPK